MRHARSPGWQCRAAHPQPLGPHRRGASPGTARSWPERLREQPPGPAGPMQSGCVQPGSRPASPATSQEAASCRETEIPAEPDLPERQGSGSCRQAGLEGSAASSLRALPRPRGACRAHPAPPDLQGSSSPRQGSASLPRSLQLHLGLPAPALPSVSTGKKSPARSQHGNGELA